jgi:hypothetical protein
VTRSFVHKALVFGEYMTRLFYHSSGVVIPANDLPVLPIKLSAFGAVLVVTLLGAATPNLGTRAAVVFAAAKASSKIFLARLH